MSEFQYYDFRAVDRALTADEQAKLEDLSSRVELSASQAVFTYDYGDFPGAPDKVLAKYFDAMLYYANWGSRWLYFRLPAHLVRMEELKAYSAKDVIHITTSDKHVIVRIEVDQEGESDWLDPVGQLDRILPVRQQLLEGDYRALYLAWLNAHPYFNPSEDDDIYEPPVPPGLRQLTGPLEELAEFLEIPEALVEAAAQASPELPPTQTLEEFVPDLSPDEQRDFLRRVTRGDSDAASLLRNRLTELARGKNAGVPSRSGPLRRLSDLLENAERLEEKRSRRERHAREQTRRRELELVAQREPELWQEVDDLIDQKQTKAYDRAVEILTQLKELAADRNLTDTFLSRIEAIEKKYPNRSGLRYRLSQLTSTDTE